MNGDHSHSPTAHEARSLIAREFPDERRSESGLSYATERSVVLSPSGDPVGPNEITPHGRRSPYVVVSSRDHTLYQARRSGTPARLDAIDSLDRRPPGSDERIPSPPTSQDTEVPGQPAHTEDDSTDRITPAISLPSAPVDTGVQDMDSPKYQPSTARNPHLDKPSDDVEGNATAGTSTNPANDTTTPVMHEGPALPTVNTRAPSVPPPRRVRARGVFIIGNGAPIKIDEGIEVYLRDGVGGQVDFII